MRLGVRTCGTRCGQCAAYKCGNVHIHVCVYITFRCVYLHACMHWYVVCIGMCGCVCWDECMHPMMKWGCTLALSTVRGESVIF